MSKPADFDVWLEAQWAHAPEVFCVEVEGARIACRGWNLAATHLPALILVHGFRAHAQWWDHIAPALVQTHRVVALSLSGMGDSDRREAYSRALYGREIMGVAAACGWDRVTLVAHSFGCLCAISAAATAPEVVDRLVIIDAGLPVPGARAFQIPEIGGRSYATQQDAADHFRFIPAGSAPHRAIQGYIGWHSVREEAGEWGWKFDPRLPTSLNAETNWTQLPVLSQPVDIILGDLTSIMTDARIGVAQQLSARVSAPIRIALSDHHVMAEQPIALIAALQGLLAR